jgi:hypothetical protein
MIPFQVLETAHLERLTVNSFICYRSISNFLQILLNLAFLDVPSTLLFSLLMPISGVLVVSLTYRLCVNHFKSHITSEAAVAILGHRVFVLVFKTVNHRGISILV